MNCNCIKSSPWGCVQSCEEYFPGFHSVSTASHGGIKLSRELNAKVPDYMRRVGGFYEEDCDWSIAFVIFEKELLACGDKWVLRNMAGNDHRRALATWRPDMYERYYKTILKPGESYIKDERAKQAV